MATERTYSPHEMFAFGIEMVNHGMTMQHAADTGELDPQTHGEAFQEILRKWGLAEHVITEVPEP